jgi:hypothetical protein
MLLSRLAWNPRSGGGLDVFFSRYLFSIGLRSEKWLHVLAELLQVEARPSASSPRRVAALLRVPSVAGCAGARATPAASRAAARRTSRIRSSELALTIYSRYRLGPALRWHLHLLGQLLGEFYVAKLREEKLRQRAICRRCTRPARA